MHPLFPELLFKVQARCRWLGCSLAAALLLVVAASPGLADAPASPRDPMGTPARYAMARGDDLFMTRIAADGADGVVRGHQSSAQIKSDLSGFASRTPYSDADVLLPQKLLLQTAGRFTDPLHDQILYLHEGHRATDGSLFYSLFSPTNRDTIPAWQPSVPTGNEDSPAALAVGDLDRRVAADGTFRDEAAVAIVGADRRLQVHVLDYNAQPDQVVDTAQDQPLPIVGNEFISRDYWGSLAIGIGDFDGDGQNEIAVVWQSFRYCYGFGRAANCSLYL